MQRSEIPVARKRTRSKPAPDAVVMKAKEEDKALTDPGEFYAANIRKYRRHYSRDEALELAGTPEDPVARGAYTNSGITTISVKTDGKGDNTVGMIWKTEGEGYHIWAIQPAGTMKYAGVIKGTAAQASEKLLMRARAIALSRALRENSKKFYEEWRGPIPHRKKSSMN